VAPIPPYAQKYSNAVDCAALLLLLNIGLVLSLICPGISGGVRDRMRAKLRLRKNGCFFTSAAPRFDPSRLTGSLSNNPEIRSHAWTSSVLEGVGVGNARGFLMMLRRVVSFDGAAKGVRP